ncbi:peptidase U32 family protein [Parabacteroides pacaensis]|uniref:peptidase U32 family protein n=1 Tax=Parabacteroides pacaensis TaxID=2086575 RepID=UPI000D0FCE5D|nr:U32 family peptidase [Parabacteroides pacaensis]
MRNTGTLTSRPIELLSPAKDFLCGIEAINHGADAVYIGAPKFGARVAAGNTIEDIRRLCDYAHRFRVRIYVALNTILKDEELGEAEKMIHQLYQAGADALIVQDMGILQLDLPPIPLHASTQTDNRTPARVRFLEDAGFTQVVLARELSLNEIHAIASQTTVPLEVFIHGALCVSYSGQCYLSAALSGRSANRGECAQCCRLPYTLVDAEGKEIIQSKHLLSLKDMNRAGQLEALLDAGVSSLKIEGRLKDVTYVKNVTAYYRNKLDTLFKRRTEYRRASSGRVTFSFEPVAEKSFNRGFTEYFLQGRSADITAFDTPKSLGEKVGTVKEIKGLYFTLAGIKSLSNGDGLVFFNEKGILEGFRVNKVEENRIYPQERPASLRPKLTLYRNYDHAFEKQLLRPSAERKIAVSLDFADNTFGFTLSVRDEDGNCASVTRQFTKELARGNQAENIRIQLGKLGNTIFTATDITLHLEQNWFVPSSVLADVRRLIIEKLELVRRIAWRREVSGKPKPPVSANSSIPEHLTYLANVSNKKANLFYTQCGVKCIDPAFELLPQKNVPLMFTKHCLRYSLGYCPHYQKNKSPYKEPFYLVYNTMRLRLQFDCKNCMMVVYKEEEK